MYKRQTLGSPVSFLIRNLDYENWQEIMNSGDCRDNNKAVTRPRPGHADLPGAMKYCHRDMRNIPVSYTHLYPPFNWTQIDDSNGAVPISGTKEYAGGYDVEIAKRLAEGMGKELVIVKTSWSGLPPAVQSGNICLLYTSRCV